jgi:DNA-binding transcriptional ArsR family regulator
MTNPKTLRRNNDPFTSHESASKVDSTSMENIVCEVIDSFGEAGCISDQVQYALAQYRYSSVTARYKALKDKGLVIVDEQYHAQAIDILEDRIAKLEDKHRIATQQNELLMNLLSKLIKRDKDE